jgi:hypothetical protein
MTMNCERCGFPAQNISRLIKHIKTIVQCPSTRSKISHEELIDKLRPPPCIHDLTCTICHQVCKTPAGLKTHLRACKAKNQPPNPNPNTVIEDTIHLDNVVIPVPSKRDSKKPTYIHKNMSHHKDLKSFTCDINLIDFNLNEQFYIDCCSSKIQGVVDFFIKVHNHPDYENIKWYNDKLIIYDGKGWTELTEGHLIQHLGSLFSILEEKWCDYQMHIRCGMILHNDILCDNIQSSIDEFFYTCIVDDESVHFHCKKELEDYLQTLKNIGTL